MGSPHFGAVQFYKPLEAGEIDRANTFLWLAEKIVLILNKSTLESDRVTIANKFPVAKDVFPTFNFLKDTSGNEISIDDIKAVRDSLKDYSKDWSEDLAKEIQSAKKLTPPFMLLETSGGTIGRAIIWECG